MAGHKSRSYGRFIPDVISSLKMLPLKLFDCFHPAAVGAGLLSHRQCQLVTCNLVICRATMLSLYGEKALALQIKHT